MGLKTTFATATTAVALIATPAVAQETTPKPPQGKATAPGQLCKAQSKKKTMKGKGQSPFAACVVGVKRAQREVEANETKPVAEQKKTSPAKLCADRSKKKAATDKTSPFAACVSGAAKAQNEADAS